MKIELRDSRKRAAEKRKLLGEKAMIAATIESRRYKNKFDSDFKRQMLQDVDPDWGVIAESNPWLISLLSPVVKNKVTKIDGNLTFPIIFAYPEYETTDLIEACNEDTWIIDLFDDMFSQPPAWDQKNVYVTENLIMVSKLDGQENYSKIDFNQSFKQILKSSSVEIVNGYVSLILLNKYTDKNLLSKFNL